MRKLGKFVLEFLPGAALAVFLFLASIGPEEARSNLAKWAVLAHIESWPPWLTDSRAKVLAILVVALFYVGLLRRWWRRRARNDDERKVITDRLVEEYKSENGGQQPSMEWLNTRLLADGHSWHISGMRPATPSVIIEGGGRNTFGKIDIRDSGPVVMKDTVDNRIDGLRVTGGIQSGRPVSLVVERNQSIWFALRLVNNGPAAAFRAELRIVGTNARSSAGDLQAPLWFESARSLVVHPLSGGSEWIRIARADLFTLFRYEPHYLESTVLLEEKDFEHSVEFDAERYVEFEVTVLREPPLVNGPYTARFRYATRGWNSPTLVQIAP